VPLHAFDDIDDALDATRDFLTPVDRGRWLRLALVVLFVGGPGFNGVPQFNVSSPAPPGNGGPSPDVPIPSVGSETLLLLAAAVGVLLLLGLLFLLVGSVMEFVLVESLRAESVRVRAYWRRHLGRGLRLFGFRVVFGLASLLLVGGPLAAALSPLLGGGDLGTAVALLLALSPVLLVVVAALAVVYAFTTQFVVPVMLLEERGVLSSWSRLWPTIRREWREFAVYAVVAWLLGVALGIVALLVLGVAALVLAIPFVLVGVVVAVALSFSTAALVVAGALAAVYVFLLVVVAALVKVPVRTYLRHYALFVLGDTNPDFDAIPDVRSRVRSGEPA